MASWNLVATKDNDRVTVVAAQSDPSGEGPVVRFECWASHLEGLMATQRRAYLAGRIREALAAPAAYAVVPASVDVP